jgi:hypothetical protein
MRFSGTWKRTGSPKRLLTPLHYLRCEDARAHEVLCIQSGDSFESPAPGSSTPTSSSSSRRRRWRLTSLSRGTRRRHQLRRRALQARDRVAQIITFGNMAVRAATRGACSRSSRRMREALRQVNPTVFEDLIALVALPSGPMGYIPFTPAARSTTPRILAPPAPAAPRGLLKARRDGHVVQIFGVGKDLRRDRERASHEERHHFCVFIFPTPRAPAISRVASSPSVAREGRVDPHGWSQS